MPSQNDRARRQKIIENALSDIYAKSGTEPPQFLRVKDCYADLGYPSIFSMYRAIRLNYIPAHHRGGTILVNPAEVRSTQRANPELEQAIKDLFSDIAAALTRFLSLSEVTTSQEDLNETKKNEAPDSSKR